MDNHLRRYEASSDAGNDSDSSAAGPTSVGAERTSFWSTVFADTSHPIPDNVSVSIRTEGCVSNHLFAACAHSAGVVLASLAH